jgi:Asp-tRNA(Asn)/Glu-tRNA(Gln) amidotransferase A subunit family amidase
MTSGIRAYAGSNIFHARHASSFQPTLTEKFMSQDTASAGLTATDAARKIRDGELTSEALVQSCLDRIEEFEDTVGAWTHLDRDYALAQAKAAHKLRQAGGSLGPLHGVPVGIKDIFDTNDMPTENGTVLHAGRRPESDSTVVALLRQAGAVIMGKTVTTELAVMHPGKTANPHDPKRTAGGSSSGSAAAVASCMVPLATGSQTNGSMIRPASFCGIYGYKPTHGLISRHGVLRQSRFLDQIGVFSRSLEDAALIAEVLIAHDPKDPDSRPHAPPQLVKAVAEEPPMPPLLAFAATSAWDEFADEDSKEAFPELLEHLGVSTETLNLGAPFEQIYTWQKTIMGADQAINYHREYERGKDQLSPILVDMIEQGQKVLAVDYNQAAAAREGLNRLLSEIFDEYDAIITPASTGQAPVGLEATGNPIFCTPWTFCGVPAVSLPLLQGSDGMPIGVQLVGPRGDDARLLRTARWLAEAAKGEDA